MESKNHPINMSSLTLREKIAQMIIVRGDSFDKRLSNLGIGGIFLGQHKTPDEYKRIISRYQSNSKIPLFVSADMEGYRNPFKAFYQSKVFGNIKTSKEAYDLGKEHGKWLSELGFNLNFSPSVETANVVWPGRTFSGSVSEIKEKTTQYIKGLRSQGILPTLKHFPGGSMDHKDPHFWRVHHTVKKEDLDLFFYQLKKDKFLAVMPGHPIVTGLLDSKGKAATVSPEVVMYLRNRLNGLIITDDIAMRGLKRSYTFQSGKMYADLVKAGNHVILDVHVRYTLPFFSPYYRVKRGIKGIEKAINAGEISENLINENVKKILEMKGVKVIK